jgi:hypothetical protein
VTSHFLCSDQLPNGAPTGHHERVKTSSWLGGLAVVSLVGLGCGDDASGTGGDGAGAGATTGTGATGTGSSTSTGGNGSSCGPEPTVLFSGTLTSYLSKLPIEDAQVTSDSCPGQVYITNVDGYVEARVARDLPFYPKIVAQSYVTIRLGEQVLLADYDASAEIYPEALTSLIPTWSPDAPTILAVVTARSGASAECEDLTGYTFSVPGHPEAQVLYYTGSGIPMDDPTATSTGELGLATISGLAATAPGEFVELTVEKAGCEPSFVSYPQTGRFVLENGVGTAALAYVPPVPPP